VATPDLPSFDLVVATVGRVDELARLLDSLEAQTYGNFRVTLVDQNVDDRLDRTLADRPLELQRLSSAPGLSHARNIALERLSSDIVAFPDDDCVYPPDLLDRLAQRFADDPGLGGISGLAADSTGRSDPSWPNDPVRLTPANVWNRAISFGLFFRRGVVESVGAFDERLGLGSGEPWSSGEEIDYVIRALQCGACIEFDPTVVVRHELKTLDEAASRELGLRDGASVGYLLRKHGYPARTLARMLVRPVGGILISLARRDVTWARFHTATLRGRTLGYGRARRSKSSV
jgi:glycosyltransferase involved in cell wall biosynthesis